MKKLNFSDVLYGAGAVIAIIAIVGFIIYCNVGSLGCNSPAETFDPLLGRCRPLTKGE